MRPWPCLVLLASAACADAPAALRHAPAVDCAAPGWNRPAQRLSRLLDDVSAARAFRPENWSGEDPLVKPTGTDDAALMASLSGQVNLIARYAPAPRCPGRMDVDMIWILPGKPGSAGTPHVAPREAVPVTSAAPAAPGASEAAAARMAMAMYLRAHGLEPPHVDK